MEKIMSSRLELIASFAEKGKGVADIGTDHALLPIALRQRGFTGRLVAGDVNSLPLEKARAGIENAGAADIELVLTDGLEKIDPSGIDTVVVAGMGGDTICGILDRGLFDLPEWAEISDYRLILHPVTKSEILRFWLINNGFVITSEEYIEDNGMMCQILIAQPGTSLRYTDAELYTGKYEQICGNPLFDELTGRYIRRFSSARDSIEKTNKGSLRAWQQMLDNMVHELEEMKERKHEQCR